ncbi:hypothetical protein AURDEDRAFT_168869 [Auricularia subglabra TFB-10046 SS5]|nr:hypothetical protein AURDEDRAFT_168869 [Auricularia subglabra TFB-10046 SS5]
MADPEIADSEIATVTADLADPETAASRLRAVAFALSNLGDKPFTFGEARNILYTATRRDNAGDLSETSQEGQQFIRDMQDEVAKGERLDVALDWFKRLRLKTLNAAFQPYAVIKDNVEAYMAKVEGRLRAFLSRERLVPTWEPSSAWKNTRVGEVILDLTSHLESLQIPVLSLSGIGIPMPDLLVYLLGESGDADASKINARLRELLGDETNVTLVNTSGSGKTRLLLEVLCRYFGFYFACAFDPAASPYGSRDMNDFAARLDYLQSRRTTRDVQFSPTARSNEQLVANVEIVKQTVDAILLARLMVFTMFLDLCSELGPTWSSFLPTQHHEARAKKAWVLLQVFPCLTDDGHLFGDNDIFRNLVERLRNLSQDGLDEQLEVQLDRLDAHRVNPGFLVFDEVQVIATQVKEAFPKIVARGIPRAEDGRPLLKPIVMAIHTRFSNARIFVAGTHLFKRDVELALMSSAFKVLSNVMYSDLGGYFEDNDIIATLNHFFTAPFVSGWDPDLLQEVLLWFRGRHRFLTYFIQNVLLYGPDPATIRDVISNIRYAAAGSPLPAGTRDLRLKLRSLIPLMFPLRDGSGNRPIVDAWSESREVRIARKAVLAYLTIGAYPTYKDPEMLKLVELGIARFQDAAGGSVRLSERLVHAALVNYFNDERNPVNLRDVMHQMLEAPGLPQVAGYGFEYAITHLFWDLFSRPEGALVSEIFSFDVSIRLPSGGGRKPYTPEPVPLDYTPSWAKYRARLMGNFAIKREGGPFIVERDVFVSPLARRARNADETLKWFKEMCRGDGEVWAPFLLPDPSLGPDGVCGLELSHPTDLLAPKLYLLLLISCKNWHTPDAKDGTPRGRGGEEVVKALHTMSPEGLFSTIKHPETREKRQTELREYLSVFDPLLGNVQPKTPLEVAALVHDSVTAARRKAGLRPLQRKNPAVNPHKYDDTVKFGALRCLASYPHTVNLPHMSTAEGVYPFATLTTKVFDDANRLGFHSFRESVIRLRSEAGHVDVDDEPEGEAVGPVVIPAEDAVQEVPDASHYDGDAILRDYSTAPAIDAEKRSNAGPKYAQDAPSDLSDLSEPSEAEDDVDAPWVTRRSKRKAPPAARSSARATKRRLDGP